jgi:hypothetical protein
VSKLEPTFKGIWIPSEVWELMVDKEITQIDMVLLSSIFALSKKDGCYASRDYLAEIAGVSVGTVKNLLSKYRKMGLIVDGEFDGRRQKIYTYWDAKLPQPSSQRDGSRHSSVTPSKTSSAPSSERGHSSVTADQAIYNINKKDIDFLPSENSASSPNLSSFLEKKKARKARKKNTKGYPQPKPTTTTLTQEDGITISLKDNVNEDVIKDLMEGYSLTEEEVLSCKQDYINWVLGSPYDPKVWGKNMVIYVERFCKQKSSKKKNKSTKEEPKDIFDEINDMYGFFPKKGDPKWKELNKK